MPTDRSDYTPYLIYNPSCTVKEEICTHVSNSVHLGFWTSQQGDKTSDVNLYSLDATRQIVDHTNVYKAVLLVEQAKINRLHIDTIHQYVVHTKNVHETTVKTVEIHVRMSGKRDAEGATLHWKKSNAEY